MKKMQGGTGLIPGSEKSLGGENGNPVQYSCLKNTMDRGAWQATVHGVEESGTTEYSTHAHFIHLIFLLRIYHMLAWCGDRHWWNHRKQAFFSRSRSPARETDKHKHKNSPWVSSWDMSYSDSCIHSLIQQMFLEPHVHQALILGTGKQCDKTVPCWGWHSHHGGVRCEYVNKRTSVHRGMQAERMQHSRS